MHRTLQKRGFNIPNGYQRFVIPTKNNHYKIVYLEIPRVTVYSSVEEFRKTLDQGTLMRDWLYASDLVKRTRDSFYCTGYSKSDDEGLVEGLIPDQPLLVQ